MNTLKKIALLGVTGSFGLACGMAQAQDNTNLDDKWELSAGYFAPKVSTELGARGTLDDGTTVTPFNERGRLNNDDFKGGKLEAIWKFSERQRITAGAYSIGDRRVFNVNETGTATDPDLGAVDYTADGRAVFKTDFELYRLTYGYDFIHQPNFTLTGQIGVYGAHIDTRLRTDGLATATDGTTTWSEPLTSYNRYNETKYAPGVGLSTQWKLGERWDVRASAQGFRTQWGDFDLDGHFYNAQAEVGYRFSPSWTAFAGYDWFELKLSDDKTTTATIDGVPYTATGRATGTIKVHGPVIGLRTTF